MKLAAVVVFANRNMGKENLIVNSFSGNISAVVPLLFAGFSPATFRTMMKPGKSFLDSFSGNIYFLFHINILYRM